MTFRNLPDGQAAAGLAARVRLGRPFVPIVMSAVLLAASGLAVAASSAPTDAGASSTSIPTVWSPAHVHVRVDNTSDWASVQLNGMPLAARRGTAAGGLRSTDTAAGWSFNGKGSYDADVILGANASDLTVAVSKGYVGTTRVVITSPRTPSVLVDVLDNKHESTQRNANRAYGTITRTDLSAAVVPPEDLPRADSRRLALAFAYPWFGNYRDSRLTEQPSDPRSWLTADGVLAMTRQAKEAGVDGFVLSFGGESADGASLDRALAAANATGSVVSPYLETAMAATVAGPLGSRPAVVEEWLRAALHRADDPAFLRVGGTPVVFVYAMQKLTVGQWANVLANLRTTGQDVHLIGDATDASYRSMLEGFHSYAAVEDISTLAGRSQYGSTILRAPALLDDRQTPPMVVGTVSPGYDDRKTRGMANPVVPRDEGRRYADTWAAALSGTPDWIVITSWNEWFEGTSIEPGTLSGGLALQQTRQLIDAWRSSAP